MKRSGMTTASFAALLTPLAGWRQLAGFAVCLAGATGVLPASALPARGVDLPFTEQVISSAAEGAFFVFAIDLDGDGDTDVLSASFDDDKIAWYESDDGSPPGFTERVISMNADGAVSVFATDVDGDGDLDVLSASENDNKIAWYESDGGSPPSFTERAISTNAEGAASVFAIDLDRDGDTDVLSASFNDDKIAWYESDGGSPPSFTEHVISTTTAVLATTVFATDLDGDGDIDVLSASWEGVNVAWYENDGDSPPSFTERVISTTADGATSVFATDVDGDGDTDVLSASFGENKIAWYESDGGSPPTFTERVISLTADGAAAVFAMDVDGDGDTDVLSASFDDNKIVWYESNGGSPPTFTERVISTTAEGATSLFAADVDRDGDIDVLSASLFDNKIAWYENLSPCGFDADCDDDVDADDFASFHAGLTGPLVASALASATVDLGATGPPFAGSASALSNQGSDMPFTEHVISTSAEGAFFVFAIDLDGDGDTDVLSASFDDDKIAWYESDGGSPPAFTEHVISTTAADALSVFATDVDGDGDIDVLSASESDDKIAWYENDGGSPPTFAERVISTNADGAGFVFAVDLDGDGDTDVLSASFNDDKIAWYESDGESPPSFTEHVISTNAVVITAVFATDLDRDGDIDVLSASWGGVNIAWYENDGGSLPTFTERGISLDAKGASSVFATDVDGDGDIDVLSASWEEDTIAWYESDGGSPPTFTERVISTTADGAAAVFAVDVDRDGDTDVLSASQNDDKIAWYESDPGAPGPPSFTERVISTAANGAVSLFATDVDRDGDIDVLSASFIDNKIAWYENLSPCGFDSDCDGDADLCDFASFQIQFTGPK